MSRSERLSKREAASAAGGLTDATQVVPGYSLPIPICEDIAAAHLLQLCRA